MGCPAWKPSPRYIRVYQFLCRLDCDKHSAVSGANRWMRNSFWRINADDSFTTASSSDNWCVSRSFNSRHSQLHDFVGSEHENKNSCLFPWLAYTVYVTSLWWIIIAFLMMSHTTAILCTFYWLIFHESAFCSCSGVTSKRKWGIPCESLADYSNGRLLRSVLF